MISLPQRDTLIVRQVLPWMLVSVILMGLDKRGTLDSIRGGLERMVWPANQAAGWLALGIRAPYDYYSYIVSGRVKLANLEQRLKRASVDYAYLAALEEENQNLKLLMKQDVSSQIKGTYMAAALIAGNQQAVIDKGSLDGVSEGQIVLDVQGVVVGRVRLTRPHVSVVERPFDPSSRIAVKISRKQTTGILIGKGDWMSLEGVLQAEALNDGDIVVTSGADGIYPKDLVIGTVNEVKAQAAEVTKQASVSSLAGPDRAVIIQD